MPLATTGLHATGLHQWALRFKDANLEEEFLAEHFRSMFALHVVTFATISILLAATSLLPSRSHDLSAQMFSVLPALLCRTLVHYFVPTERAHRLLHRLHVCMCGLPFVGKLVEYARAATHGEPLPLSPHSDGASRISAVYFALSLTFFPVVLHLFPTKAAPRVVLLLLFGAATVSEATSEEDAAGCLVCMLLGELMGHTLELTMRQAYEVRRHQQGKPASPRTERRSSRAASSRTSAHERARDTRARTRRSWCLRGASTARGRGRTTA
jgi:hypothetical protein